MESAMTDLLEGTFRIGKTLGVGNYGVVKSGENLLTGERVAIKILDRQKMKELSMEEGAVTEIKIMKMLNHRHLIRLHQVIETPSHFYLVMELATGCLLEYAAGKGPLEEDEARKLFRQIIEGIEHCHLNNVVHRDMKLDNLLLDSDNNVKIADFGLSAVKQRHQLLITRVGSPKYVAPEILCGKLYGTEVDVWGCGVILYALLCGALPFDEENRTLLFKKIKMANFDFPNHLSSGAKNLIARMLIVDQAKRITIPEIRQHPWFLREEEVYAFSKSKTIKFYKF